VLRATAATSLFACAFVVTIDWRRRADGGCVDECAGCGRWAAFAWTSFTTAAQSVKRVWICYPKLDIRTA
jgi:hypothetical protein